MSIGEFDLEPAEMYTEPVRIRGKLYFEEAPGNPEMRGVLVNISYNASHKHKRVCGYYYDSAEQDRIPVLRWFDGS